MYFLQQVDRVLSRASPLAAFGVLVGTAYWSAVTYGAVAVMQVRKEACVCVCVRGLTVCMSRRSGGRTQEGSKHDGTCRPSFPAHGSPCHPCHPGPGEDGPLGRFPGAPVVPIFLPATIRYTHACIHTRAHAVSGFVVTAVLLLLCVVSYERLPASPAGGGKPRVNVADPLRRSGPPVDLQPAGASSFPTCVLQPAAEPPGELAAIDSMRVLRSIKYTVVRT